MDHTYERYKPTKPYPKKAHYEYIYLYDKGQTVWTGTRAEYNVEMPHTAVGASNWVNQVVVDEDKYNTAKDEYNEEVYSKDNLFRVEALTDLDFIDDARNSLAFSYAWEDGHSEGNPGVYNALSEIVYRIKEMDKLNGTSKRQCDECDGHGIQDNGKRCCCR